MEKLPIFNFSQWGIANGGTIRFKDGEYITPQGIRKGYSEETGFIS